MTDIEPKSLVHQVMRLGKKATEPIARHKRLSQQKRLYQKSLKHANDQSYTTFSTKTTTSSSVDPQQPVHHHNESCDFSLRSSSQQTSRSGGGGGQDHPPQSVGAGSHHGGGIPMEIKTAQPSSSSSATYRTIDQKQFFMDCLKNGQGQRFVIHFRADDHHHANQKQSHELDEILSALAGTHPQITFSVMDQEGARFVAQRMNISVFPTLVGIQDKVVLDQLSEFAPGGNYEYVDEWIQEIFSS